MKESEDWKLTEAPRRQQEAEQGDHSFHTETQQEWSIACTAAQGQYLLQAGV